MQGTVTKKRNANIELLRLITMFMVIMLHALGKGDLLTSVSESGNVNAVIAWFTEVLCISAVNVFMLISGYFLINSEFKTGRLIELVFQCLFYSAGSFFICILFNINTNEEINTYYILRNIFPIHMDVFWFVTSYIVIYMLLPLISAGVKAISKKQFKLMLIVLVIYESLFKSFLPVRFEEDEFGYNFLWFLIVFLIGAYFRLYGFERIKKPSQGFILYGLASVLTFAEVLIIDLIHTKTGHLSEILNVATEYNQIWVLLSAIGLFTAFINMKEHDGKTSKVICSLSPMALGIYLFHESLSFRYNWQKWLGIYDTLSLPTGIFICKLFSAAIVIFVFGLIIDFVRIKFFSLFKMVWKKRR